MKGKKWFYKVSKCFVYSQRMVTLGKTWKSFWFLPTEFGWDRVRKKCSHPSTREQLFMPNFAKPRHTICYRSHALSHRIRAKKSKKRPKPPQVNAETPLHSLFPMSYFFYVSHRHKNIHIQRYCNITGSVSEPEQWSFQNNANCSNVSRYWRCYLRSTNRASKHSPWNHQRVSFGLLLHVRTYIALSGGRIWKHQEYHHLEVLSTNWWQNILHDKNCRHLL